MIETQVGMTDTQALFGPIEEARGLPNAAYTSESFFALETQLLFPDTWVFAGTAQDIPDPGDMRPAWIAGRPIILSRDQGDKIRAFHNACRHRGSQLVDAPCQGLKSITCPYHAWVYGLDGKLMARPHFDGPDNHAGEDDGNGNLNLVPVRVAQWFDLIFVNLSGDAPPLEEHLAPIHRWLADYDLSVLRYAGVLDFQVKANWKFAVENYMENYHVFALHPQLTRFAPMHTRSPGEFEGHCFVNQYTFPVLDAGRGLDLPHFPDLSENASKIGMWFLLFPTLGIEIFPDQLTIFQVDPVAPDLTRETIHVYLIGDAAHSDEYAEARQEVFDMWESLNHEDLGILERLQAGRASPSYTGGLFSPAWERVTLEISRLVARGVNLGHDGDR